MTLLTLKNSKILNIWTAGQSLSGSLSAKTPLTPGAPTLFFIHGLGSSQNYYYALLPRLITKANVVLMDTEGSGASPLSSSAAPTAETIVDDVFDVLAAVGVTSNVTVVGHSMGGMIALKVGERNTSGLIRKVVAVGPVHPTAGLGAVFADRVRAVEASNSVLALADGVSSAALSPGAEPLHRAFVRALVSATTPAGYVAMCNVIVNATPATYANVRQPVLIIAGADDKSAPYEGCVQVIEEGLPNVEIKVLEKVGHWHCIEASTRVADLIAAFLE